MKPHPIHIQIKTINARMQEIGAMLGDPDLTYKNKLDALRMISDLRQFKEKIVAESTIRLVAENGKLL